MGSGGGRGVTFPARPPSHCTLGAEKQGASAQQEHALTEPGGCPQTTFTSCLERPHVPPHSLRAAGLCSSPPWIHPRVPRRKNYLPVINVIIFTTPAPVIVWEPIDLCELLFAQGRHTSKILIVRQPGSREKSTLEKRCQPRGSLPTLTQPTHSQHSLQGTFLPQEAAMSCCTLDSAERGNWWAQSQI